MFYLTAAHAAFGYPFTGTRGEHTSGSAPAGGPLTRRSCASSPLRRRAHKSRPNGPSGGHLCGIIFSRTQLLHGHAKLNFLSTLTIDPSLGDAAADCGNRLSILALYANSWEILCQWPFASGLCALGRNSLDVTKSVAWVGIHARNTFCRRILYMYSPWGTAGYREFLGEVKSLVCSAEGSARVDVRCRSALLRFWE